MSNGSALSEESVIGRNDDDDTASHIMDSDGVFLVAVCVNSMYVCCVDGVGSTVSSASSYQMPSNRQRVRACRARK